MSALIWGPGGTQFTPEEIARRRKLAEAMAARGADTSPVQHWTQGVARVMEGLLAGYEDRKTDDAEKANASASQARIAAMLGGGITPAPSPSVPLAAADGDPYANAIASVESGGRYAALGPVTRTGDRAYGKYQVMGANVPAWTEAALGRKLTPQEFIADSAIQDAVFKHQFGSYVNKYGPEGAAKAWFAGEGGMNDPNRKDQLGTSVADYARKFTAALPNDPASLPPNATPAQYVIPGQLQPLPAVERVANGLNPQLLQSLTSPYATPAEKKIAEIMLMQQQKDVPKPTDEMREYDLYSRQEKALGRAPLPFFDYKTNLKKAGAIQNTVQIDQRAEGAFDKKAAETQAERFDKIAQGGLEAQGLIGDLNALKEIGARITTGKSAELKAALGPYAELFDVKIDGLDDIQAFKAITARMAPRLRVPGSGAQSDFELRQFLEGLPGLGKTPEGNAIISSTFEAMSEHKIKASEIASRALNKEITRSEAEKQLRELPDPLTLWKKQGRSLAKSAAPPPVTETGVIKWEKGPDGKPRRVQ